MAQSRVERSGSIFSRVTGLLRTGVLKWDERPLWYDVYAAHPPQLEPIWTRAPNVDTSKEPRHIFYAEDIVRAKFYSTYANTSKFDLSAASANTKSTDSLVDKFVSLYMKECMPGELVEHGVSDDIMEKCAAQVEQDIGVRLVTTAQLAEERAKQEAIHSDKYMRVQSRKQLTAAQKEQMLGFASFGAKKNEGDS